MISDIVTKYRSAGLFGPALRHALVRHAKILDAADPTIANELRKRAQGMAGGCAKGKAIKLKPEALDPYRKAWLEHDKRNGLTRD